MAKKVRISEDEVNEILQLEKKKKNSSNVNKILIIISFVLFIGIIGTVVYYNNEISSLNQKYSDLEEYDEEINSKLFSILGIKYSVSDVNNKLNFFDENVVFQIE